MKCVVIGDMFLRKEIFYKSLEDSQMFSELVGYSWKENLDRIETRALIRKIETEGSEAYPFPEEFKEETYSADVIFTHMCPIGKEVIQQAKNLKYIVTARGGVENIAVKEAQEKGIKIINCPMHNAHAVAELTVGLMICETRNLARSNFALKNGEWRESYPNSGKIREIRSSKIGLIGFGAIGQLVCDLLKPFNCEVYVNDPYVAKSTIEEKGVKSVSKEELLRVCDIVSLHGRIGPNDPPIIGEEELNLMKETSYLINTARAVLVDMEALEVALKNHKIAGAAIDVFPKEPLGKDYPFLMIDQCTLTNHRGGDTVDSYDRAPEILIESFKELLETGKTKYMM